MRIVIDTEEKTVIFIGISTLDDLISCIDRFTTDVGFADYKVSVFSPIENINEKMITNCKNIKSVPPFEKTN